MIWNSYGNEAEKQARGREDKLEICGFQREPVTVLRDGRHHGQEVERGTWKCISANDAKTKVTEATGEKRNFLNSRQTKSVFQKRANPVRRKKKKL